MLTFGTQSQDTSWANGCRYLDVRIDTINYDPHHFGLASKVAADALPVLVMEVPRDASVPATLGQLQAYRAAVAGPPPVAGVPGTYRWPVRGLLPRGTHVRHV